MTDGFVLLVEGLRILKKYRAPTTNGICEIEKSWGALSGEYLQGCRKFFGVIVLNMCLQSSYLRNHINRKEIHEQVREKRSGEHRLV
jgi:hypothetical protein